jgi:hypothetical protein
MAQAIAYSETGHLCLSTLHANNANQAMERILNFFPEEAHRQLLVDLSLNLAGVVAQRLIPGLRQKLAPAVEVLVRSPYVSDLIVKGDISAIKEAMSRSAEIGMCTSIRRSRACTQMAAFRWTKRCAIRTRAPTFPCAFGFRPVSARTKAASCLLKARRPTAPPAACSGRAAEVIRAAPLRPVSVVAFMPV